MKIIHVIRRLKPDDGGPPVVVLHLAAAEAAAGAEVHLLCYQDPGASAATDDLLNTIPGADALTLHRIPCKGLLGELVHPGVVRRFDQLVNDAEPAVAHLHGLWELMLVRVATQARRRGAPYLLTMHGLLDPYSLNQKRLKKRIAMTLMQRRMLNDAAAIHALNDDEKQLLAPLGLNTPIVVVPNGVDLDTLLPLPSADIFRSAHPQLGAADYFLFLSRLHHKKGLDILADAYAAYVQAGGSYHLVVAGPDEGQRDAFAQQIAHHNLTGRVHIVGPIYADDKRSALAGAKAFVLPTRQEAFSIAITEALAAGVPVLISQGAHFPQVAEVGAGRVLPLDPAAFADAMLKLEADPAAATQMSRAGAQLVRDRYTWPQVAAQMIATYQSLLPPTP